MSSFNTETTIKTIKKYQVFIIGLFVIFLYFLPYLIYGDKIPIFIHDSLDDMLPVYKVLAQNSCFLCNPDSLIPQVMNGLPRFDYNSEFSFLLLFFILFNPFTAYLLNIIFISLVGYIGMYLLLKNYIFEKNEEEKYLTEYFVVGISLAFSLLPLWPFGALSISSLPLVLYSFLNIRNSNESKKDWFILIIIPFYSYFYYSYVFFLSLIFILFIYDYLSTRRINKKFLSSIFLMTCIFVFIEYKLLISSLFDKNYISHRMEYIPNSYSFLESYFSSLNNLQFGQLHTITFQEYIIFPLTLFITIWIFVRNLIEKFPEIKNNYYVKKVNYEQNKKFIFITVGISLLGFYLNILRIPQIISALMLPLILICIIITLKFKFEAYQVSKNSKSLFSFIKEDRELQFIILLLGVILNSFIFGFWDLNIFYNLKISISYLRMFQIRYYWLQPMLWFILFAIGIMYLNKIFKNKVFTQCLIVLIVLQILIPFQNNYYLLNPNPENNTSKDYISFESYYAVDLFSNIKNDINKSLDSYKVASLGFPPSVTTYNGFYTLDGYMFNYPLSYKHEFRIIIAKELEKNQTIRDYFDGWGNRCYLFSSELGLDFTIGKTENISISNLELNMTQFKLMGGNYIFSTVLIKNYLVENLSLLNIYETPTSYWKIYLYQVL